MINKNTARRWEVVVKYFPTVYNQLMGIFKKITLLVLALAMSFVVFTTSFAEPRETRLNAVITAKDKTYIYVEYPRLISDDGEEEKYEIIQDKILISYFPVNTTFNVGSDVSLYKITDNGTTTYQIIGWSWDDSADQGFKTGGDIWKGTYTYHKLFKLYCKSDQALSCWLGPVFNWGTGAVFLLALGGIVAAGLMYMTSAGNPDRISTAKKLIKGALSAVAIIVLGRFFLTQVIGVPWL